MAEEERRLDIRYPQLHDPDWLRRRFVDEGAGIGELAAEVGCKDELVRRALRRHQVLRPPGEEVFASPCPELQDDDWLRRAYLEDGLTGPAIAKLVGCSLGDVYRALRRVGIGPSSPRRVVKR